MRTRQAENAGRKPRRGGAAAYNLREPEENSRLSRQAPVVPESVTEVSQEEAPTQAGVTQQAVRCAEVAGMAGTAGKVAWQATQVRGYNW